MDFNTWRRKYFIYSSNDCYRPRYNCEFKSKTDSSFKITLNRDDYFDGRHYPSLKGLYDTLYSTGFLPEMSDNDPEVWMQKMRAEAEKRYA